MLFWGAPILVGFIVSAICCQVLCRYRGRWAALDQPNLRSLHDVPVSRLGGVAIVAGIAGATLVAYPWSGTSTAWPVSMSIMYAFLIVVLISFIDDVHSLPPWVRLASHVLAAVLVVHDGLYPIELDIGTWSWSLPVWVSIPFSILFVVWMINLYNFMDGMDGFASGMGLIGFGSLAVLGVLAGAPAFAQLAFGVAAACVGLLLVNFPPARLFMGDTGAASLGLLAAVFMLWAERRGVLPLWAGVVVFSPFIVDASWTLSSRIVSGHQPWRAHREHFYQRLVRLGWSHRRTVLWEYCLMLYCAGFAIGLFYITSAELRLLGLGLIALGYLGLAIWIDKFIARRSRRKE